MRPATRRLRRRKRGAAGLSQSRLSLRQPAAVPDGSAEVADRVADGVQHRADDRVGQVGEPVVHPEPLLAPAHEAGLAQIRQVPGRRRLGEPEALVDVADADFPSGQQPQNPQACAVGERFEQGLERVQLTILHAAIIFVLTDIVEGRIVIIFA